MARADILLETTMADATPQETWIAPHAHTPSSSAKDSPYRLLYRGALSLPDSYLSLDGIAFSARLPNRDTSALQDSPSISRTDASVRELMYNPLALALESMRGRQTLRFKGTVDLADVWTDDAGDVYMDIHPLATLTKIYFENTLCLAPLVAPLHGGPKRTELGVRVSLGDTDGPETMDIAIYGETSTLHPPPLQLSSAAPSTSVGPPPLSLRVARITPTPRAPRPDDPTPRQPPTHLLGTTFSDLGKNKRITPTHDKGEQDHVLRRAREVMLHLPRSNINGRDAAFKVPELPAKARRKQGADVFGAVELPSPNGKGKGKVNGAENDTVTASPIEDANKLVLKKTAVHRLSKAGIPRSHPEFKDLFGFVYRGAAFALRSQMRTAHISAQTAEAAIEAHVKLYVPMSDAPLAEKMCRVDAGG